MPSNKKTVAKNGAYFQNDGPADHIPVNLNLVPDAVPQDEPLIRSANLPYSALGMSFRPDVREKPYHATGRASWYGKQFHGRKTTSGERYDMFAMTAAHPTLPIPSYARVTNLSNGKSVVVRVNDRGPFHKSRLMDLSFAAAYKLGFIKQGSAKIAIDRVWPSDDTVQTAAAEPATQPRQLRAGDSPKYLQLGSFTTLANAEALLQKTLTDLDDKYDSKLGIVNQQGVYKVRLGPFPSDDAVRSAAENLHVETVITSL
ncbi:septal ring lytic transglycosylase RlpA family protein [Chromobacterium sp. IIBBL 290-4]|uniref:septal ring lytic transglycosylase RlpA family protein n=1 Tax=Chromobacterium sp. IIBBL 290-4 TaxID=2953890 RepID=UPI0020B63F0B|nr:septal ring lytic transglycosylase RlpA family protein [Chromobacterium sp. IIBBL 290-4]UTH75603.1 septal ring lytic transglycosylase RlpA family protein [Chromobacterium sp. IIBBL 290-4]